MKELDTDIVRKVFVTEDGTELEERTPYIVKEVLVPQRVRMPLYVAGVLKSEEELNKMGLTVKEYTRLEVETEQYGRMYATNPDLVTRVHQYKALLDELSLNYDSTSNAIVAAIDALPGITDTQKLEKGTIINTTLHDVEVNLSAMGEDGHLAWLMMPKLIKYLPKTE